MSCKKKSSARKKPRSIVCVICKGDKKIQKKAKCCSSTMTSKSKGSWNL